MLCFLTIFKVYEQEPIVNFPVVTAALDTITKLHSLPTV